MHYCVTDIRSLSFDLWVTKFWMFRAPHSSKMKDQNKATLTFGRTRHVNPGLLQQSHVFDPSHHPQRLLIQTFLDKCLQKWSSVFTTLCNSTTKYSLVEFPGKTATSFESGRSSGVTVCNTNVSFTDVAFIACMLFCMSIDCVKTEILQEKALKHQVKEIGLLYK